MGWLSQGVETLVERVQRTRSSAQAPRHDYDVIVVGSGYGGAVAACRYAQAGYSVCVLERGSEMLAGEFPNDLGALPGHLRLHRDGEASVTGRPDALFDLRLHRGASVLVGNALGGGSQINANVALRADPQVLRDARWPAAIRDQPDPLDAWYSKAEDMLGVAPYPHPCRKADALEELAAPLSRWLRKSGWQGGVAPEARFFRPPLAVSYREGENRFGVAQNACTGCGDCVTGCNFGAKNTLTMNYLPEARRYGAEIFTGATVLAVKPEPQGGGATLWLCHSDVDWSGHLAEDRPVREAALDQPGIAPVRARVVVLAAGSLGSTEILLRSRQLGLLSVSPRLGTGFSGNGDALGFVFDQRKTVDARGWGTAAVPHREQAPGPTIAGVLDLRAGVRRADSLLIEDGILPGALGHFAHELLTSAALLQQLGSSRLLRDGAGEDPLALCDEALRRTQVYLAMGHDEASGSMALERGRIVVHWPGSARSPHWKAALRVASSALGGVALADPISQPLPEELSELLAGPRLEGNAMIVHPLGGCPMGEDFATGVVDHAGAVFSGETPRSLYDSLYVWDGAALPTSLGANPFLTIAALAERAAELAIARLRYEQPRPAPERRKLPARPARPRREYRDAGRVGVLLRETIRGTLDWHGRTPGQRPQPQVPAALQLRMPIPDLLAFLKDPEHRLSGLSGSLSLPALDRDAPLTVVGGDVALLVRVPSTRLGRTLRALVTWFSKRGRDEIVRGLRARRAGKRSRRKLGRLVVQLLRLANHAGEQRLMRYSVRLRAEGGERYTLEGTKRIRYARDSNLWDSLLDLHAVLRRDADSRVMAKGTLRLDLIALAERDLPQVLEARDTPQALLALASLALFFMRVGLKIHLWDFRQPDYPSRLRHAPLESQRPLFADAVQLGSTRIAGERHWIEVKASEHGAGTLPLALTRFSPPGGAPAAAVMLMAGFAQSARAFIAEPLEQDLVRHLLAQGFEVWLFDYRTSTALPSSRSQCSLDDVAGIDIPAAIEHIRAVTSAPRIAAMGHCMGSATLSMALLSGRLHDEHGTPRLAAAVFSQVPPYIVGGAYSQWRRQLAAMFRDVLRVEALNLAADDGASTWETLMDRAFATLPVGKETCPHEHDRAEPRVDIATCKRVTGIIGPLYRHGNVTRIHGMLDRYFGWASVSVFNQIAKFFEYERLVSAEGGNVYVHDEALRRLRLPLLLLHGAENQVFHPESSRRTLEQLKRVNGGDLCELFEPPGYAHFDCLVGDRAHQDVFPRISGFLQRALAAGGGA